MVQGSSICRLQDAAFEPSSALRHAAKLSKTLLSTEVNKSVLFLYSDGGPDHKLTNVSVQVSLIAKLDLDFFCVARTVPSHSWHNPVERVMPTLSLGLQCIGLKKWI